MIWKYKKKEIEVNDEYYKKIICIASVLLVTARVEATIITQSDSLSISGGDARILSGTSSSFPEFSVSLAGSSLNSFLAFDPALGTLNDVSIDIQGVFSFSFEMEANYDPIDPGLIVAGVATIVFLDSSLPGNPQESIFLTQWGELCRGDPFGFGVPEFKRSCAASTGDAGIPVLENISPANVNQFIGDGFVSGLDFSLFSLSNNINVLTSPELSESRSLLYGQNFSFNGLVTLNYEYASPIPLPATFWLFLSSISYLAYQRGRLNKQL